MFFRHSTDKFIYPLVAGLLVLFLSYRSIYRLRPEMPAVFYSSGDETVGGQKSRSVQQEIARAYWKSARMELQWRYPFGHQLPADPPPQFHIDGRALGPEASDPLTRELYWQRLQQLWSSPLLWQKQYVWDWSWIGDPITAGAAWLRNEAANTFNVH
jgi:hypothetical protein